MSISILQASSASCRGPTVLPARWWRALSTPTVTTDEDPRPVPLEGMSAIVVISTPLVTPVTLIASLTRSCCTSSTLSTVSILEYDNLIRSSKRSFTVTCMYRDIAVETTRPPRCSFLANPSRSVPPPQNETRTGVFEMIITLRKASSISTRRVPD